MSNLPSNTAKSNNTGCLDLDIKFGAVKSSWESSLQSAAVASSLLASVSVQLVATSSSKDFQENKQAYAVDILLIVSYGAVLLNASAAVTSLILVDKLSRLLKEPAQRTAPKLRKAQLEEQYIAITGHLDLLKAYGAGGSWKWYLVHCASSVK
ncbi:hypothetical protein L218DRAFT_950062 [Marasmius fiardii PR-910]|nr:hypothetical protein L218DRAFT_950062 [Marasmius fiardii PR-910]